MATRKKTEAEKVGLGRDSDYTPEMGLLVCDLIGNGKSLREVAKMDGMPSSQTILRWVASFPVFREQYTKAREELLEHWADDILEISDNGTNDYVATHDPDNPGYRLNGEHYQRSRLRVDSRKWLLSKLAPRKYGDTQTLKVAGSLDTSPQSVDEIKAKAALFGISEADLFGL